MLPNGELPGNTRRCDECQGQAASVAATFAALVALVLLLNLTPVPGWVWLTCGLLIGAYYAYVNDSKRHLHEEAPELTVP